MTDIHVYDTTLRDGAQQEGLNLSVADKLAIAQRRVVDVDVGHRCSPKIGMPVARRLCPGP